MGRNKETEPRVRHVNLRLRAAEYDWLMQRAQRLSKETGLNIKPTMVAHGFITSAVRQEQP